MTISTFLVPLSIFVHIAAVILFIGNASLGPSRRKQARQTGNAPSIYGPAAQLETLSHAAHVLFGIIIALMIFRPSQPLPW